MAPSEATSSKRSELITANRDGIPELLRSLDRWILWKAERHPDSDKVKKIPIHHKRGHNINQLDAKYHLSFEKAWSAYDAGRGSGRRAKSVAEPSVWDVDGIQSLIVDG